MEDENLYDEFGNYIGPDLALNVLSNFFSSLAYCTSNHQTIKLPFFQYNKTLFKGR